MKKMFRTKTVSSIAIIAAVLLSNVTSSPQVSTEQQIASPETRQTKRQWSGPSILAGFPWWEFAPAHDTEVIVSVETPRFLAGALSAQPLSYRKHTFLNR